MIKTFLASVITGSIVPLLADNVRLYRQCSDLNDKLERAERELKRKSNFKTPRSGKIVDKNGMEYPIGFY